MCWSYNQQLQSSFLSLWNLTIHPFIYELIIYVFCIAYPKQGYREPRVYPRSGGQPGQSIWISKETGVPSQNPQSTQRAYKLHAHKAEVGGIYLNQMNYLDNHNQYNMTDRPH